MGNSVGDAARVSAGRAALVHIRYCSSRVNGLPRFPSKFRGLRARAPLGRERHCPELTSNLRSLLIAVDTLVSYGPYTLPTKDRAEICHAISCTVAASRSRVAEIGCSVDRTHLRPARPPPHTAGHRQQRRLAHQCLRRETLGSTIEIAWWRRVDEKWEDASPDTVRNQGSSFTLHNRGVGFRKMART